LLFCPVWAANHCLLNSTETHPKNLSCSLFLVPCFQGSLSNVYFQLCFHLHAAWRSLPPCSYASTCAIFPKAFNAPSTMLISSSSAFFHMLHVGHCLHAAIHPPKTFSMHETVKARGHKSACTSAIIPTVQYNEDRNVS